MTAAPTACSPSCRLCALLAAPARARAGAGAAARPPPPRLRRPVSDVLKAPRPQGGEYFGLYLMDKKVGYVLHRPAASRASTGTGCARSTSSSSRPWWARKLSERLHREERIYEAKPSGRLLSFVVEAAGRRRRPDAGGHRHAPKGCSVVRKRPGVPDETLHAAAQPRRRWRTRTRRAWRCCARRTVEGIIAGWHGPGDLPGLATTRGARGASG